MILSTPIALDDDILDALFTDKVDSKIYLFYLKYFACTMSR